MINVFYRPEQVTFTDSFSPSSSKPKFVVSEWLKKFPEHVAIRSFEPVTEAQIAAVHDPKFVKGVLNGTAYNGFGNKDMNVAKSLPYTSGSMLAAAKCALETGIAASPTSGFHHATLGGSGGYCTFNGLMVTAVALLNEGLVHRVGIADNDFHYGNGTHDIITKLKLKKEVIHFTAGEHYHDESQALEFLDRLPKIIRAMGDCDIILYQAGADPWIDDPLGGFLTKAQLRERDQIVFETCKEMGVPCAWNLAGGYSNDFKDVLDIHNATFEEALKVFG